LGVRSRGRRAADPAAAPRSAPGAHDHPFPTPGGGSRRERVAAGPARVAILEVAIELLDERGPDGFTIDDVLVLSGASASSLYHHFRNREGLVVAAQAQRYRRMVRGEDRNNLDVGTAAQTTEEFLAFVAGQLRRIVTDPAIREVRRSRLEVAGRAMQSPELAEETRRYQDQMFDAITAMFDDAQARGLIDGDLDTRAYCAWFHGMTLGRTIAEDGDVDAESWLAIAIPAALAPLLPRSAGDAGRAGAGAGETG
jgi:AcrR family transcriptional regulator